MNIEPGVFPLFVGAGLSRRASAKADAYGRGIHMENFLRCSCLFWPALFVL